MSRGTVAAIVVASVLAAGFVVLTTLLLLAGSGSGLTGLGDLPRFGNGLGYVEIEGTILDSRGTIRQLKQLERSPTVRGLLLRVNSPGGVVTPAHEIYSEICRIRDDGLPVVASLGTVAASGGYYVACPADIIVANPGTLTGSIGVIMEFPVFKGLMDKLGLKVEVVKSDRSKDIGSPFREMVDEDREILQSVVGDVHDQFIEVVSLERGIPSATIRPLADGRIFTGRQALTLDLVDTLGTFEDARRIAADLAGITGEPRLIRPKRSLRPLLLEFLESFAEKALGWPRSARLSYLWR